MKINEAIVSDRDILCVCVCVLGIFTKLRKAAISFVMAVRPSVRLTTYLEHCGSHWMGLYEMLYLNIFLKSVKNIQYSLKSDKKCGWRSSRTRT